MEIRPCGGSFEYCDGNCAKCDKGEYTTSDHTEYKFTLNPSPFVIYIFWNI